MKDQLFPELEPLANEFITKSSIKLINMTIPSNAMEKDGIEGKPNHLFEISRNENREKNTNNCEEEESTGKTDEQTCNKILNLISNEPKDLEIVWKRCYKEKSKANSFYDLLCLSSQDKLFIYQENPAKFSQITVSVK